MGTNTIRAIAAAALLSAVGVTALAQDVRAPEVTRASFTAGQGGSMQVTVRANQTFYSFTGDVDSRIRAQHDWQQAAGPQLRVGQAEITLPSAR